MSRRTLYLAILAAALLVALGVFVSRWHRAGPSDLASALTAAQGAAANVTAATPQPTATPDANGMSYLLSHEAYGRRLWATLALATRDDIPAELRASMLADALAAEVGDPSSDAPPVKDVYLPPDSLLRLRITRVLSEMQGALPATQEALAGADGLTREHLLVALAYQGDPDVLPEVRDLVLHSQDVAVRMDAARALGMAGDEDAIPVLVQALTDPELIHARDSMGEYKIYPVRDQAAGSLGQLGVVLTLLPGQEYRVEGDQ
jgi:HEAT repeat protein